MFKKLTALLIFAVIFIFCVIGICRWPDTERLYVTLQPSPYASEEFADMSKSDKLLRISGADMDNFKYIREGIYPLDYTPDYIPLAAMGAGAGASFTAILSMFLDFYIAKKRKEVKA